MGNTTHQDAAQRRADLRVARKAKRDYGISVTVTRKALVRQRRAEERRRKKSNRPTHRIPFAKGMHPRVVSALCGMDVDALRVAGARALPDVLGRYQLSLLFTPLSDASWVTWKRKTEMALQYRRRVLRENTKEQPLTDGCLAEMVDLELALIFLRQASRWSASRAVHTAHQYSTFLEALAKQRDGE